MTDILTITVMYSCTQCGLEDRKLAVPARREDMDLMRWMKGLQFYISRDHETVSPTCTSRVMRQLKIPIQNADRVGGPPIQ